MAVTSPSDTEKASRPKVADVIGHLQNGWARRASVESATPTDLATAVEELETLRQAVQPLVDHLPPVKARLLVSSLRIQDEQTSPRVLKFVESGAKGKSAIATQAFQEWMSWAQNQIETLRKVEAEARVSA